jgi:hypothetical protein
MKGRIWIRIRVKVKGWILIRIKVMLIRIPDAHWKKMFSSSSIRALFKGCILKRLFQI